MKYLVVNMEKRTSAVGDVVWLLTFFKGFVLDEERAENNKTKRYVVAMIILLAMGMDVL